MHLVLPANKSYVAYVNSAKWATVSSGTKGRTISFKLAKAQLFAVAPKESTNWAIIILSILTVVFLLIFVGAITYLLRRRQNYDNSLAPPDYGTGNSAQ